jgi:hypothetical protein
VPLPVIDAENRKKPLCYDPKRQKFILYDELLAGTEPIVPISSLGEDDVKKLVIERQRRGPDYDVQAITGPRMSRDDVIAAIERGDPAGMEALEADRAYLEYLLDQIAPYLPQASLPASGRRRTRRRPASGPTP